MALDCLNGIFKDLVRGKSLLVVLANRENLFAGHV